ncbi:hypothetical protein [Methanoregula sp.]
MRKKEVFVFFCALILIACLAGCIYTNPSGAPVATTDSAVPVSQ